MGSSVIDEMVAGGVIDALDAGHVDDFIAQPGLRALLFCGASTHSRETHDVAVALRELVKDYSGQLRAGVIAAGDDPALHTRFRVLVTPSLVLVLGGDILEVLPGVRDWADYTATLQRYLGAPGRHAGVRRGKEYSQ